MQHKNYSKISEKQKKEKNDKAEEVMDIMLTEDSFIPGEVFNCDRLYVRTDSSIESDPICVIDAGDEVFIDLNNSTDEFYKVTIAKSDEKDNIEGYCLKDYIIID